MPFGPDSIRIRKICNGDTLIDIIKAGLRTPYVFITSPNGQIYRPGDTVVISASVWDSNNTTVRVVNFYIDSIFIGNDSITPYSITTQLGAGVYEIRAVAIDNKGAMGMDSRQISIQYPNIPPTVTITSPPNNATFRANSSMIITANAHDSDGTVKSVQFYRENTVLRDTTLLGEDSLPPYSLKMSNILAGTYRILAKVFDNRGAIGFSKEINFTVQ